MIRVLLADDHAIVLEGLRALLDGEPDIKVAAWTTDGTEGVSASGSCTGGIVAELLAQQLESVSPLIVQEPRNAPKHAERFDSPRRDDGSTIKRLPPKLLCSSFPAISLLERSQKKLPRLASASS